jgi:hypothetical protein
MGQTLEHHAIANEQLLLRHLSNNHDDHQHGFSSDDSGRLSYQNNYSSSSYSGGTATVERSYQPVSEQNSHPPVNQTHLHSASGSSIQRTGEENSNANQNPPATSGGNTNVDDIIKNQESMERMARRVYQIMRDQLLIERDRGFGPGNGKFF